MIRRHDLLAIYPREGKRDATREPPAGVRNILCSELTLVNPGDGETRYISLRCRAWTCEHCQPIRQRQLIALAQSGNPTTFITLTCKVSESGCPASRARALVHAWRAVVKRAKKKYGYERIPFLAVFEATKRGEPHLHILARVPWIDQRWLSAQMDELLSSPIVDIRRVRSARQVAGYVAKYVGKAPHRFDTCKRYWSTRDWDQSDYERDDQGGRWSDLWYVTHKSIWVIEMAAQRAGGEAVWEGDVLVTRGRAPPYWSDSVMS